MKKIHVIGITSLIGKYFVDKNLKKNNLILYSRTNQDYNYLDILKNNDFKKFDSENSYLVSFTPIWLTKKLILSLIDKNLKKFKQIKGIVVFSSTSVLTKRFSINNSDKKLYAMLSDAENEILKKCKKFSVNCVIIRPTIIYGQYYETHDKNLFLILNFLKKIPFILIPTLTGYRQPIHFSQLSNLTDYFLNQMSDLKQKKIYEIFEVGGDEELTYKEMIIRLKKSLPIELRNSSKIITIPNYIFNFLISPLLVLKPNIFEKIYRMGSNFSGFTKYSSFTGEKPSKFPLEKYKL